MKIKNLILILTSILLNISLIYSACYWDFQSTDNYFSSYAIYSDSLYSSNLGSYSYSPSVISTNKIEYQLDENLNYKLFYFYLSNKRIIPTYNNAYCGGGTGVHPSGNPQSIGSFTGYKTASPNDFKQGLGLSNPNTCQVSFISIPVMPTSVSPGTFNINFKSNLDYLKLSGGTPVPLPTELNSYYHMNMRYKVEAVNTLTPYNSILLKDWTPVMLPEYNIAKLESFYWTPPTIPGSYQIKVSWDTSVEPKCSGLSSSSFQNIGSPIVIAAPVEVVPLPVITSFTASPGTTINYGQSLSFSWQSTYATECRLKLQDTTLNPNKEISSEGFSVTALPDEGSSATYRLICFNSNSDSDFEDRTITVNLRTYSWHNIEYSICTPTCTLNVNSASCTQNLITSNLQCKDNLGNIASQSNCGSYPISTQSYTQNCNGDTDTLLNGDDLCDEQNGLLEYQGCPFEYRATCYSPSGDISFDGNQIRYISGEAGKELFFSSSAPNSGNRLVNNAWYDDDNIFYTPTSPGFYSGNTGSSISSGEWRGYCDVKLNANPNAYCSIIGKNDLIRIGERKKYFKYNKILLKEKEAENSGTLILYTISYSTPICVIGGTIFPSIPTEYLYENTRELSGPEYDNLIRDHITGELKVNDTITIGKLSCDSIDDTCSLKVNSTSTVDVNLVDIPQTRTKEIKIIKNGNNTRNDTIDISLIAMQAHKIQRFTSNESATSFIAKSYNVMTNFDITKNLTYNPVTNKTTVRIVMNNIPESDNKNITLYMVVDKSIANSLENISNIEKGNAEFFVVDKDPIIGWYFNESGSDEEIGYEVPGESEGGTVIITQTPILYNEGELIINYRETDCSAEELTLFELDNLIDSKVYAAGSSQLYKVCLTHLDSNVNLYLNNPLYNQSIDVMSYTDTENASSNPIELANKITLSTDNSSLYWDVRVQKENPSGNYSCIGSLDLVNQSSLFGDCGYNEDARVWIHLGDDYNAPETTLSYPGLAHTLKVTLTAFEPTWESGVKNLSYRVLEDNESFTTVEDDTISFIVTCPNDWNCKKTVEYYAYDKAGNKEETKTKELLLIDKGSACQADCTAKPSPNRYLKECTNLNSCEFYQFNEFGINDGGDYVANQCDYLAIGSWATYNQTHEILCPKGPFRESKFTNTRVNVIDESNCENILKTPYPVIFDGENIIMNVISCINYEE